MSFADLQSARKAKKSRSFATSDPGYSKSEFQHEAVNEEGAEAMPEDVLAAKVPSALKVQRDGLYGRGLYATDRVRPGTVLISCRPHVSILSTQCLESYCSYCCEASNDKEALKRCTGCRQVFYCNLTCQNNDWSIHKLECASLQRWKMNASPEDMAIPGEAVRCLGRILWTMQKEGHVGVWAQEFNAMQSHRSSLPPSSVESHTHLAHALVQYLGVSSPTELAPFGFSSPGHVVDLISRFTTNTFTLTTSSLSPIGICVSPTMALANHSCEPNAVLVFPHTADTAQKPNMQLIAIRDIKPNEQVLTSYIDITVPKELRQRDLMETYNFTCTCRSCSQKEVVVDPRASVRCPKSCGGIGPAPIDDDDLCRCNKCGAVVPATDSIVDALRVGQQALDKATALQFQDPDKAKQLTSNLIPILTSSGLRPSSHPLLALYRLHQELLVGSFSSQLAQSDLDEAIRTAAKYNAGLSDILPPGHPVRGIAIAELGKLLAVDEPSPASPNSNHLPAATFPPSGPSRLRLARETLIRALEELSVGFGKSNGGGQIGREVHEIILRLDGELGVWTQGVRNVLADSRASRS